MTSGRSEEEEEEVVVEEEAAEAERSVVFDRKCEGNNGI